ncbi:hypothetical protein BCU71_06535 [Vibrio lentus]|uniref:WecB/TagA/CpsF family glycosyltransferase n=1 Tax=Vibrio lentus TaxID=136468 RepID=UPI000C8501C5|nr:WecB/TagA/CpsF family glycosyltransferase [Vibrio lentus]PMH28223.1 hypothetical protein BCU71_06535 [Vibrio lentus]PMK70204.1 hypothetical protein BCT93_06170 [Vibrio lentus]
MIPSNLLITKDDILNKDKGIYSFINPFSHYHYISNKSMYESFDGVMGDGALFCYIAGLLKKIKVERVSFDFTSIADEIFKRCESGNVSLYVVGSDDESVRSFCNVISNNYAIKDVSFRSGYFESDKEYNSFLKSIADKDPDVIICGMGALKQERFLLDVRNLGWNKLGFTCGGFIHQTASSNELAYYPEFIDKFGLRFFYRMYDEPKLIFRYFKYYPIFLCRTLRSVFFKG